MSHLMTLCEIEPPAAWKFLVEPRLGLWRVLRNNRESRTFADRDEAVRFACGSAREHARTGHLGIVVVRDTIDERHCYTPPRPVRATTPRLPALRLVRDCE